MIDASDSRMTKNKNAGEHSVEGSINSRLERLSRTASDWSGRPHVFVAAVGVVLGWAASGPYFRFSDTWQLVINTGTTIVTFLMVFLIQRAQNNDSRAVHLKLNEIVAALQGASNRLIAAEALSETELQELQNRYLFLAKQIGARRGPGASHTIEETESLDAAQVSERR
jgi:low affinity Fe/Cu permease